MLCLAESRAHDQFSTLESVAGNKTVSTASADGGKDLQQAKMKADQKRYSVQYMDALFFFFDTFDLDDGLRPRKMRSP